MEGKITGMVIDQTRTEGKWYVRELKDGNGGVRPLFFRREKSDLVGRLIDKFMHVESAQRYAARHMKELGFDSSERVTDVYSAPGKLKRIANEQKKLAGERLQKLLSGKVALAAATRPGPASRDSLIEADTSPPITVIRNKAVPRQQLDRLWQACRHQRYDNKQDKAAKKDFEHLMGQALRLLRGELASNDPEVWRECREFIRQFGDGAWTSDAARQDFGQLRNYFFPATNAGPAVPRLDAEQAAVEAGKMGFALERLLNSAGSDAGPGSGEDFRQSLEHVLQLSLEEHSSAQALEIVFLPWPRVETSQDRTELADLLGVAKGLRRLARNDDRALLDKAVTAIERRMARIAPP